MAFSCELRSVDMVAYNFRCDQALKLVACQSCKALGFNIQTWFNSCIP